MPPHSATTRVGRSRELDPQQPRLRPGARAGSRHAPDQRTYVGPCLQDAQAVPIGEHGAATPREPVEPLRCRHLKALHAAREGVLVIGLDHELEAIAAEGQVHDPEVAASERDGEGTTERAVRIGSRERHGSGARGCRWSSARGCRWSGARGCRWSSARGCRWSGARGCRWPGARGSCWWGSRGKARERGRRRRPHEARDDMHGMAGRQARTRRVRLARHGAPGGPASAFAGASPAHRSRSVHRKFESAEISPNEFPIRRSCETYVSTFRVTTREIGVRRNSRGRHRQDERTGSGAGARSSARACQPARVSAGSACSRRSSRLAAKRLVRFR